MIIRVTYPVRKVGMGGAYFQCTVCRGKYDTVAQGEACAIADFARKDAAK